MTRLNNSLYRIKATPSRLCACGREQETVVHFLFRCTRWHTYRREMLQCTKTQRGNLSFFLGGKSPLDGPDWKPNLKAVQATIRFALSTGRLENKRHTQTTTFTQSYLATNPPLTPINTSCPVADAASAAVDRILNTWGIDSELVRSQ